MRISGCSCRSRDTPAVASTAVARPDSPAAGAVERNTFESLSIRWDIFCRYCIKILPVLHAMSHRAPPGPTRIPRLGRTGPQRVRGGAVDGDGASAVAAAEAAAAALKAPNSKGTAAAARQPSRRRGNLVRRLRSFACERSAAFRYEKPLLPPAPPAVLSSLREEARALWALYGVMTRGRSAGAARGPWHACLGRQIALAAKARRRRLRRMRSRWRRRQDSRRRRYLRSTPAPPRHNNCHNFCGWSMFRRGGGVGGGGGCAG